MNNLKCDPRCGLTCCGWLYTVAVFRMSNELLKHPQTGQFVEVAVDRMSFGLYLQVLATGHCLCQSFLLLSLWCSINKHITRSFGRHWILKSSLWLKKNKVKEACECSSTVLTPLHILRLSVISLITNLNSLTVLSFYFSFFPTLATNLSLVSSHSVALIGWAASHDCC